MQGLWLLYRQVISDVELMHLLRCGRCLVRVSVSAKDECSQQGADLAWIRQCVSQHFLYVSHD